MEGCAPRHVTGGSSCVASCFRPRPLDSIAYLHHARTGTGTAHALHCMGGIPHEKPQPNSVSFLNACPKSCLSRSSSCAYTSRCGRNPCSTQSDARRSTRCERRAHGHSDCKAAPPPSPGATTAGSHHRAAHHLAARTPHGVTTASAAHVQLTGSHAKIMSETSII